MAVMIEKRGGGSLDEHETDVDLVIETRKRRDNGLIYA
jgi:hypothetical protein